MDPNVFVMFQRYSTSPRNGNRVNMNQDEMLVRGQVCYKKSLILLQKELVTVNSLQKRRQRRPSKIGTLLLASEMLVPIPR